MTAYFTSEVVSIGSDATEMFDGGVVILFGEPCPSELADVSIVHKSTFVHPERDPRPGDQLRMGDSVLTLTQVGSIAGDNLRSLGHIVLYIDPEPGEKVLPGAVHATGTFLPPQAGATIDIVEGD